jgi:hypothetical protein
MPQIGDIDQQSAEAESLVKLVSAEDVVDYGPISLDKRFLTSSVRNESNNLPQYGILRIN